MNRNSARFLAAGQKESTGSRCAPAATTSDTWCVSVCHGGSRCNVGWRDKLVREAAWKEAESELSIEALSTEPRNGAVPRLCWSESLSLRRQWRELPLRRGGQSALVGTMSSSGPKFGVGGMKMERKKFERKKSISVKVHTGRHTPTRVRALRASTPPCTHTRTHVHTLTCTHVRLYSKRLATRASPPPVKLRVACAQLSPGTHASLRGLPAVPADPRPPFAAVRCLQATGRRLRGARRTRTHRSRRGERRRTTGTRGAGRRGRATTTTRATRSTRTAPSRATRCVSARRAIGCGGVVGQVGVGPSAGGRRPKRGGRSPAASSAAVLTTSAPPPRPARPVKTRSRCS